MPQTFELGPIGSEVVYQVATGGAREFGIFGPRGEAKALRNDEPVLTSSGWVPIGDLNPGQYVYASDGCPTIVTGVYPQGIQALYEIIFSDRSSVICSLDHLWGVITCWDRGRKIRHRNKRGLPEKPRHRRSAGWSVVDTATIKSRLESGAWERGGRWAIPLTDPIQFPEKNVPLDPYLMGVLLGDGTFRGDSVSVSSADEFIVQSVEALLPPPLKLKFHSKYDYVLSGGYTGGLRNPVKHAIRQLGLDQHFSHEKFIPDVYLWNAPRVRLAVLQGLMDTDGTVLKHANSVSFSTASERLADGVDFLVRSFGGVTTRQKPKRTWYNGEEKRLSYKVTISLPNGIAPFRLPRKARLVRPKQKRGMARRFIVDIRPAGHADATCIKIDHPSGLFVTKDFIVTHNTQDVLAAMWAHSVQHEKTGHIFTDHGRKVLLRLPVPWIGFTDFHTSHKNKTKKSLEADHWQGAWETFDDCHLAVLTIDGIARVRLELFGIEDKGAHDKVRTECCGVWCEEPAPATEGPGVDETSWDISISSQRIPTHAAVAVFSTNYPDKSHWTWVRMKPNQSKLFGYHPDDPSRMYFRVPIGDNKFVSQKQRDEMRHALRDRPDLLARLVDGRPGAIALGKAVAVVYVDGIPMGFNEEKHTAPKKLEPMKGVPIYVGQDGGHCCATTIGQPVRGKINILASLVPPEHSGMKQQYEYNVVPWFQEHAPWALRQSDLVVGVYDPALPDDESDSDRNPLDVCQQKVGGYWEPGPTDWFQRKEAMFNALSKQAPGSNFEAALQIDPIDGQPLLEALGGRWYIATDRNGNITSDRPKKPNMPWGDIGDSFCYFLIGALAGNREKPKDQDRQFSNFDARFIDDPRVGGNEGRFDARLI